jgi:hypothetical protein
MSITENPTDSDTTGNSTAAVTTPVVNTNSVADAGPIKIGNVVLRGVTVALDTDVGQAFVAEFPRPVQLGVAARAWPMSEVQDWIAERIAVREHHGSGDNGAGEKSNPLERRRVA